MSTVLDLVELETADVAALDLSMIKRKLQDPEEGMGWTAEVCDEVEVEYKRYLMLKKAYPDREIVPRADPGWIYRTDRG